MAEAVLSGEDHLVCKPGCSECCVGPFPINYLDARRLRRGIREIRKTDPGRAARVVERARQTALLFAPEFRGDPSTGYFDGEDGSEEALAECFAETPCPALHPETGLCEIYEFRPIPCRTFGLPLRFGDAAVDACRLCFTSASQTEVEAATVDVDPPACGELLDVEHGLDQTVIAFALAFTPDD